jgi:hypothetical protein
MQNSSNSQKERRTTCIPGEKRLNWWQHMQEMLNQLLHCASSYPHATEEEERKIASYLLGELPIEQVSSLINPKAGLWYSHIDSECAIISSAVIEEPALYSRLDRFLKLMRFAGGRTYDALVRQFAARLGASALFFSTSLGGAEYARWACKEGLALQTEELFLPAWERDPEGFTQALGTLHSDERGTLASFAMEKEGGEAFKGRRKWFLGRLQPGQAEDAAELFSIDFSHHLCHAMMACGHGALRRFLALAAKSAPQAMPWLESAIAAAAGKGGHAGERFHFLRASSMALMSKGRQSVANELLKCAMKTALGDFMPAWAECLPTSCSFATPESARAAEEQITKSLAPFGMGEEWAAAWIASLWLEGRPGMREAAALIYEGREGALRAAAEAMGPPVSLAVARRLGISSSERFIADARAFLSRSLELSQAAKAKRKAFDEFLFHGKGSPSLFAGLSLPVPAIQAVLLLEGMSPAFGRLLGLACETSSSEALAVIDEVLSGFFGMSPEEEGAAFAIACDSPEKSAGLAQAFAALAEKGGSREQERKAVLAEASLRMLPSMRSAAGSASSAERRLYILEALFSAKPDADDAFLIDLLSDKSVKVRRLAKSFLAPRKDLAEEIRPLLEAKKKEAREAAGELLEGYESGNASDEGLSLSGKCGRALAKGAAQSIAWAFPDGIPVLRWKDTGGPADESAALYYIWAALSSDPSSIPPLALECQAALSEEDRHGAALTAYQTWMASGAPAKRRAALLLYGLNAREEDVIALEKQIAEWCASSRGQIASDAVRALAAGGSGFALMAVDSLSRSSKNKAVRSAASAAFEAAAEAKGTTVEALGDLIVPNLGFSPQGEKGLDYGSRSFKAVLANSLAISLYSEGGKQIKSLPKPSASDDPQKAEAAKAELLQLKKSLKAVVATQKSRLEAALTQERYWAPGEWKALFVDNPIMQAFATALIWGQYEEGQLISSFRYMEDGSFTTSSEEDCALDEGLLIGLAHPLEMVEGEIGAWETQLEDYEIVQPFPQLARGVYAPLPEEKGKAVVERFAGAKAPAISVASKLLSKGWRRGPLMDHGDYYSLWGRFGPVSAELRFTGYYAGYADPALEATIGQLGFYPAGEVEQDSYKGGATLSDLLPVSQVPPRPFSEALYALSSSFGLLERDKGWASNSVLSFPKGK